MYQGTVISTETATGATGPDSLGGDATRGAPNQTEEKQKMSNRVFVGGLAWATDDESLRQAFEEFGEVTDAKVIQDRDTGRSRGFGFVSFADSAAMNAALQKMDGAELDGRTIRVNEAQDRLGLGGGVGGGGGGGGYRGGGGGGGGHRGGGGGGGWGR